MRTAVKNNEAPAPQSKFDDLATLAALAFSKWTFSLEIEEIEVEIVVEVGKKVDNKIGEKKEKNEFKDFEMNCEVKPSSSSKLRADDVKDYE